MYLKQKISFRFDLGNLTYLSKTFDVAGFEFRQMGWNFQSQMCPQSPLVGVHAHTHALGRRWCDKPNKNLDKNSDPFREIF